MIPLIAVLAALAMLVQDVLATVMVIAENRNKGALAGALDSLGWLATITTTSISVTSLQGHSIAEKVWVLVLVSAANFFGTWLGVIVGQKFVNIELVVKSED